MIVKIDKLLVFVMVITIINLIFISMLCQVVGADDGYYLQISRQIFNGKIYFIDISGAYNPLSIVILGLQKVIFGNIDYKISLLTNYLFIIGSAFFLKEILKFNSVENKTANFYSLFFILSSLNLQGTYVVLEPISVFFQITSIWFYFKSFKKNQLLCLIFCGVFVTLSFLSKQYGLFIIAPIFLDLVLRKTKFCLLILAIIIGLLIPLIIYVLYLNYYGLTFKVIILSLLGKSIALDIGSGSGLHYTFNNFLICFASFVVFNLFFILLPFLFNTNKLKNYSFAMFLFFSSLSVLIFASYYHYFQYIIPYLVILFAILYRNNTSSLIQFSKNILFTLSIGYTCYLSIKYIPAKYENCQQQKLITKEFTKHIPKNSKVYFDVPQLQQYYFLCNYNSINDKKIGYSFPGYFYESTIVKNTSSGSFIIVDNDKIQDYRKFLPLFKIKKMFILGQYLYKLEKK